MNSNQPSCPVCHGAARIYYAIAEHKMFRCVECLTTFLSPFPTPEDLATFYNSFHLSTAEGGLYDDIEARMASDFPRKVQTVLDLVGPKALILDVGCGKGSFVKECRSRDLDAVGVDLSQSAICYATHIAGIPAFCEDLCGPHSITGTYDCITLWATIEHLTNPHVMLRSIRRLLRPSGYLALDTGIGQDWLDRMLPGVNQWYDPPQHIFVHSAQGMKQLLHSEGFDIVRLDRSFERNSTRRVIRTARAALAATMLRTSSIVTGLKYGPPYAARFPLGNLMQVIATPRV